MSTHRPSSTARSAAFTLVEVMVASVVLVFGLLGSIAVMQRGLQATDRARHLTAATELMQTHLEDLRLRNWSQIAALPSTAAISRESDRFRCTRTVRDVKEGMREIILAAEWTSYDGRPQQARIITLYSKHGLSDYISTAH